VSHSLALLEDLQHRLLPKMPIQTNIVDEVVDFLKSPTLALYADAQRFRLSVWAEFYQKWLAQLTRLGDALQRDIEESEAAAKQNF
jgi:ribonucleotide reductase beta subunit family protein with ferritin-like domain